MMIHDQKTYCNPLAMPDCPRGTDPVSAMSFTGVNRHDFRSIGEPGVFFYDNKWYMFPSYQIAYVSEDFATWRHIDIHLTDGSLLHDLFYSPAICKWKDKILLTGHSRPLYAADRPEGPYEELGVFRMPDGTEFTVPDPGLFCDDDGSVYLYWNDYLLLENGVDHTTRTLGAKLSSENPCQLETEPVELNRFCAEHTWECWGEHNQVSSFGWIEGQWMYKKNGRYYLLYSGCGAQFTSYAQGVYYSDEGPLTGFHYQPNNPLTYRRQGIVAGPGHGSICDGPNGTIWVFYCVYMCYEHQFERRIGMDQLLIDENGYLYCPKITDTPQYAPGTLQAAEGNTDTGLLPLFYRFSSCCHASSYKESREPIFAIDENTMTWWQPADDDPEPTYLVHLRGLRRCQAVRILWREVGLDYDNGIVPEPIRYVIEGAQSKDGPWQTLLDESGNQSEECVTYRSFAPKDVFFVRLRILSWAKGTHPGVTDFMVFGNTLDHDAFRY